MRTWTILLGLLIPLTLLWGCSPGEADDDDASDDDVSDDDDVHSDDDASDDDVSDDDVGSDDDGEWGDDDTSGAADDDDDDDDSAAEPDECDDIPEDPTTLYLSADDSNSQAAPALARQLIEQGAQIHGNMRLYEFLNYYDFHFPPAQLGHLDIHPQIQINDDGTYTMLIGVVAPSTEEVERRPRSLTFSVDSSGSMSGHAMDVTKETLRQIAHNLQEGDIVSLLSWDTNVTVLLELEEVDGPDDPDLMSAIESLSAGGSTDLHTGLVRAYELAESAFSPDRLNRVILISDGGANTGQTDEDLIALHSDDADGEGIYMVGIGADDTASSYDDDLMDTITDAGRGAYVYIDDEDEAAVIFGDDDRFVTVMEVAARAVGVEMVMPAGYVMEEFHGEAYSEDPTEVEPQHLAPGDAMLFHQVLTDCTPEAHDGSEEFQFTVTWQDPVTRDPREDTVTLSVAQMLAAADTQLLKADIVVAYAQALTDVWDLPVADRAAYLHELQLDAEAAYTLTGDDDLFEVAEYLALYAAHL